MRPSLLAPRRRLRRGRRPPPAVFPPEVGAAFLRQICHTTATFDREPLSVPGILVYLPAPGRGHVAPTSGAQGPVVGVTIAFSTHPAVAWLSGLTGRRPPPVFRDPLRQGRRRQSRAPKESSHVDEQP